MRVNKKKYGFTLFYKIGKYMRVNKKQYGFTLFYKIGKYMRVNKKKYGFTLFYKIGKYMRVNKKKYGFTLIELLVVITIIGILATGARAVYVGAKEKSRDAIRLSDMKEISNAIKIFHVEKSRYPNQDDDGISNGGEKVGDGAGSFETALAGYMNVIPSDPISSSNSKFYYAYDPKHSVDNPIGSCNGNGNYGNYPVLGFHKKEVDSASYNTDTCSENDQHLHHADYNVAFFE